MLPSKADDVADLSKVFILYGDNGSGKTSILQAVFHLISHARRAGHRTHLAHVPFRELRVEFSDSTYVSAKRSDGDLVGAYLLTVGTMDAEITAMCSVDADGDVPASVEMDRALAPFERALRALGLDVYYLSDDRQLYSDVLESEERGLEAAINDAFTFRMTTTGRTAPSSESLLARSRDRVLSDAISRAVSWIQGHIRTASTTGDANVNTIYDQIVRGLLRPVRRDLLVSGDASALADRLDALASRSTTFVQLGLLSPLTFVSLTPTIRRARPDKVAVVQQVLGPYLDGVEARLDALQPVHDALAVFIDGINSFFTNKHVEFDPLTGLTVSTDGQRLEPQSLSSGEKHLLLLYCNILSARDRRSVFIIDEPELSLNVKWQRRLVDSLLKCTEGNKTQFLMATHSIELLATHSDHVVQLTDVP